MFQFDFPSPKPLAYAIVLTCAWLLSLPATASSEKAWQAHEQEVIASCVKASGLRLAHALGKPFRFSDKVGFDALMIAGHYPQAHMNNAKTAVLCLFNRTTRTAETAEAAP